MELFPSLSAEDIQHFHVTLTRSVAVRSHFDALLWLQGDMQRYLPHNILVAAWGDFQSGAIQHDIISTLKGVRSINSDPQVINPLLLSLFTRWSKFGRRPLALNSGDSDFQLVGRGLTCALGSALLSMHCALVHGICDERGSHDCLYVIFSDAQQFTNAARSAMGLALPYVDAALRQLKHLPHQEHLQGASAGGPDGATPAPDHDLSERESQVLYWVTLGKTNPEIGLILEISAFTVKNHMKRIFKKLDVFSRAAAVGKFKAMAGNA